MVRRSPAAPLGYPNFPDFSQGTYWDCRCNSCRFPLHFPERRPVLKTTQRGSAEPVLPDFSGTQEWVSRQDALSARPASSSDSGVMVLSAPARILHMNGRARALMTLFGEAHELWPNLSQDSMPAILTEFCGDVFAALRGHSETHEWAQFEMRRICHMVTPPLLLRGFCMPSRDGREPRMILTLQPCSPSHDTPMIDQRPERSTETVPASASGIRRETPV
jgi:hypothetical protein